MAYTVFEAPDADRRYRLLELTLSKALDQASRGKGEERHGTKDNFENQNLCTFMREAGIAPAMYQVTKKAKELLRFKGKRKKERQIQELLGIIVYAAAAVIILEE